MTADLPHAADVVIVGAGPAGLAAAAVLRAQGAGSVLVLDREPAAGGIPRHCGHYPYGLREFRRLMRGPDYAARLVDAARTAGASIRTGISVLALHPGPRLTVTSDAGIAEITARLVLIATGVRETPRAARLIGGTKPGGVMSTGALQGLVYLDGLRPFLRPVILGTELVSFSAILTCRHAGIRPVAMVEPGPRPIARWPSRLFPSALGIALHTGTEIVAIEGQTTVTGVVLRGPEGATHVLAADGVIVTGGFQPEATLVRGSHLAFDAATGGPEVDQFGRCSDPAFFAAGNLLRAVETAGACWAEGRAVAQAMLRSLAAKPPAATAFRRIRTDGGALGYAMPQRLTADPAPAALPNLHLRVTRPVSGRLLVSRRGAQSLAHAIDSRPERRILVPLPTGGDGDILLTLDESPP